jgi:hypothetical protein
MSSPISPDDFGRDAALLRQRATQSAPLLEAFVIDFVETVPAHGFVRFL